MKQTLFETREVLAQSDQMLEMEMVKASAQVKEETPSMATPPRASPILTKRMIKGVVEEKSTPTSRPNLRIDTVIGKGLSSRSHTRSQNKNVEPDQETSQSTLSSQSLMAISTRKKTTSKRSR